MKSEFRLKMFGSELHFSDAAFRVTSYFLIPIYEGEQKNKMTRDHLKYWVQNVQKNHKQHTQITC